MEKNQIFELKEEHVKLINRMHFFWDKSFIGAPFVSTYRPYGNSDSEGDIADILGIAPEKSQDEGYWSSEQLEFMYSIHDETKTAIQVVLSTKSFEPGTYESQDFGISWEKVNCEHKYLPIEECFPRYCVKCKEMEKPNLS